MVICARCHTSRDLVRLGNVLMRTLGRILRRNLYACQLCRIRWHERGYDPSVPVRK